MPGNTWIDGGEENVAVAKTIHYTADEVKAGDYIYSGRSTSDGGLRKRYPNGKAQVIADPKPQSVAGKTEGSGKAVEYYRSVDYIIDP